MINKIFKSIKEFNWRLWLVLSIALFIPAVYQTIRIYFLGDIPTDYGVNIASQLTWINLIYEIIEEAFILPLFFLLSKSLSSKEELENKTRTGLLVSGLAYFLLTIIIIVFAKQLCLFMAVDKTTLDITIEYIRLESVSLTFSILSKYITVLFITLNKDKYMYILLLIRSVLSILLDTFFISKLPISFDVGVNGIAFSNIIVSLILVLVSFMLLKKENINIFSKNRLDFSWLKEYEKIGLFSGLESFVRNIAFILMVSRLVNVLSQQGIYWIANSFIWTWLLLPTTALYDVIKKEIAEDVNNIKKKTLGYISISIIFCLLWFISMPLWKAFIKYILNNEMYGLIVKIVLIQTPFYIIYIFNCICDGTIYGRGKTSYMLIESLFTNGIYYVLMFVLWKKGIFIPTLENISLMFGVGMAIDLIPTLSCYLYLINKENYKIK